MANAASVSFSHTFAGDELLEIYVNKYVSSTHNIAVTTYDNVKYKLNLYDSTGFNDVLKRGNSAGFTTSGAITITDNTLEVKEIKSEGEQAWTTFSTNAWSAVLGNGVGRADLSGTPLADFLISEFVDKTIDNMISCDWFGVYASGVDVFGSYDGLFLDMLYNGNGGNITKTTVSGYTTGSALNTDAAIDTILPNMYNDADITLRGRNKSDLRYLVSPTIYQNYEASLRNLGTEMANMMVLDGRNTLAFNGIPVVQVLEWERDLANSDNPLSTLLTVSGNHLGLLTTQDNLVIGTDYSVDSTSLETWYNIDEQKLRMRTQTVRGAKVRTPKLISLAYFF